MKAYTYILLALGLAALLGSPLVRAQERVEMIKYGDFNSWVTRVIKESKILGGQTINVYEIGPTETIIGNKPYTPQGGSPWGTSNVYACPMGISKASNAVFPEPHEGFGLCAKLCTEMQNCKAMGIVNINVMVTGSIFLGHMIEPIKSTKNPNSHMDMGVPFTRRPKAVQFDYKVEIPADPQIIYSSGFGSKKTRDGLVRPEVFVVLQKRWEDEDGNLFAARVGTARERFDASTRTWVMNHRLNIHYGPYESNAADGYMNLIPEPRSYYAYNSQGKLVPVKEVEWAAPDETPTHIILMFSTGSGRAYEGTPGVTLWIDNAAYVF